MAAAQTQKRATANAGRAATTRGSQSRASASRSRGTAGRTRAAAPPTSRVTSRPKSRAKAPVRSARGAKKRRERGPSATTLFIVASILFAAWTIYPVLRIQYIEQRNVATLEAELAGLQDRNAELRTQVDELKTPEGVEEIARETLGMVKPGEQAYVVTGGSTESTHAVTAGEASEPLWRQMLDLVFGLK